VCTLVLASSPLSPDVRANSAITSEERSPNEIHFGRVPGQTVPVRPADPAGAKLIFSIQVSPDTHIQREARTISIGIVKKTPQTGYEVREDPDIALRLSTKQDYRHLESCYLTKRFNQIYPSSTRLGKRKHIFPNESNGDDNMMNMHLI